MAISLSLLGSTCLHAPFNKDTSYQQPLTLVTSRKCWPSSKVTFRGAGIRASTHLLGSIPSHHYSLPSQCSQAHGASSSCISGEPQQRAAGLAFLYCVLLALFSLPPLPPLVHSIQASVHPGQGRTGGRGGEGGGRTGKEKEKRRRGRKGGRKGGGQE